MNSFKFVQNKTCEYFPCHKAEEDTFNCLFCYCPLYSLGSKCGGNFAYLDSGVKSCENCIIPHTRDGYDYILKHIDKIIDIAKKKI